MPECIKEKAKACLLNETYETWMFLKDFPQETFRSKKRRGWVDTSVMKYTDNYLASIPADNEKRNRVEASDSEDESIYDFVRKNSQELLRASFMFIQSLLQRSLGRERPSAVPAQ